MMRPRWARRLLPTALALTGAFVGVGVASAQDLGKLGTKLQDAELDAQQLMTTKVNARSTRGPMQVEDRLAEGAMFYRLQDYSRSSILLTDIVDNYPQHRAVPEALYLLGESLYALGDYHGARTRHRALLARANEPAFAPYAARAVGRLIEIAIRTRDFDGVDAYFDQLGRLPPQEVHAAASYFRAKYLFNRALPDGVSQSGPDLKNLKVDTQGLATARSGFQAVPENSLYYPQSAYFVGVISALERQYPQSIEAFQRVIKAQGTTPEHAEVKELARVALGRVYYETQQLDKAIDAYQSVPPSSKYFGTALYEIAWVHIRNGDSKRAERSLKALMIAAPQSPFTADASLLRGNLLLRNGKLKDASEVFRQTAATYKPVRERLDELLSQHEDTEAYFRTLVRENIDNFDPSTILPPEAAQFATDEADMQPALDALANLSQARGMEKDTTALITRLELALATPNLVNVFADLRGERLQTILLRNRLAKIRLKLMESLAGAGPSSASQDLASIQGERRALVPFVEALPTDEEQYEKRTENGLKGFRVARREVLGLESELQAMEAKIVASERYLGDTLSMRPDANLVAQQRTELREVRTEIGGYRKQIGDITIGIEAGRMRIGVGDANDVEDEKTRTRLTELVERERASLNELGVRADPNLDRMFLRVASAEALLGQRDQEIDRALGERTSEFRVVLDAEKKNMDGYRNQLATIEGEAEVVVGGVAYASLAAVRKRVYGLVVRAEVGVVDVAWARRERHRVRVEGLTRERASVMRALDEEYREIMDRGQGDEQ